MATSGGSCTATGPASSAGWACRGFNGWLFGNGRCCWLFGCRRFRLGRLLFAGGDFAPRCLGHGLQLVTCFRREAFYLRELAGLLGAGAEFFDRKLAERPGVIEQDQNFFRNLRRSFFNGRLFLDRTSSCANAGAENRAKAIRLAVRGRNFMYILRGCDVTKCTPKC